MKTKVDAKKYLEEKNGRMTFARALKSMRMAEDMSQSALAEIANITTAAISRFESGQDFPTSTTLRALTDALGASFDLFSAYVVQDMAEKKGFNVEVSAKKVVGKA